MTSSNQAAREAAIEREASARLAGSESQDDHPEAKPRRRGTRRGDQKSENLFPQTGGGPTFSQPRNSNRGSKSDARGPLSETWPATAIEFRAVADLVAMPTNARTHTPSQVKLIANSMIDFGWTIPVLVDDRGNIIAGHGRCLAAAELMAQGHKHFAAAPIITARGWSEAQKQAYALADNRIAEQAGWDKKLLGIQLQHLGAGGLDLSRLGFSASDLARLAPSAMGLVDGDLIPEIQEKAVSSTGALWHLGDHRLLCGDATNSGDVTRLLQGDRPHLMVTDPPYGVNYDPSWRRDAGLAKTKRIGAVANDFRADWTEAWRLFPGDVAYVWHAGLYGDVVAANLKQVGFDIRTQIIWVKKRFTIGRGHYHWGHEPCFYAVRSGANARWNGARDQSTVWEISSAMQDAETVHSTQKPLACMRKPIENNSVTGDMIYEPFCGSGTTLIACQTTGRRCLAIEIDPRYVDIAVRRWQAFTGRAAVLSDDGITFDELAAKPA